MKVHLFASLSDFCPTAGLAGTDENGYLRTPSLRSSPNGCPRNFGRVVVRPNPWTEFYEIRPADASVEGAHFSFYTRFFSGGRFSQDLKKRDFLRRRPVGGKTRFFLDCPSICYKVAPPASTLTIPGPLLKSGDQNGSFWFVPKKCRFRAYGGYGCPLTLILESRRRSPSGADILGKVSSSFRPVSAPGCETAATNV